MSDPILLSVLLFAIWILLPLVPSLLIYRLFPNTPVAVSGPLAGLTISASGAFAAYLIVVLMGWPLVNSINHRIERSRQEVWTVGADLQRVDPQGRVLPLDDSEVTATMKPTGIDVSDGRLEVLVRRDEAGRFPRIVLAAGCAGDPGCEARPGGGAYTAIIDLNRPRLKREMNRADASIEITEPVKLKRRPGLDTAPAAEPPP